MWRWFKIYRWIAITGILVGMVSCTGDFEELNRNPNAIGANADHPDMLLTHAVESLGDQLFDVWLGHEIGSCWVQHMAKVQYTDEDRYVPRNDVINSVWNNLYAGPGIEIQRIYEIGQRKGHANYIGVALVLKSYLFSVLTDLYGDIPYTQAFNPDSNLTPQYDTQESIYLNLIQNLKYANELLNPYGDGIEGDILFHGDILKWKKFANSLRLRILLRMSGHAEQEQFVKSEMSSILGNSTDNPIFTSNSDNAALHYLGSYPNNHPLNETYKTRDDHRVSRTLVDVMYNPGNHDNPDWRIVVYAQTPQAGGFWIGLPNGLTSAKAAAYLGNGIRRTSKIGEYFIRPNAPAMFMSFAEVNFILAEAAQRNLIDISPLTPKDYYEMGIDASYRQYAREIVENIPVYYPSFEGVSINIDDFITDFLNHNGAWDAANPLQKIATQKWVAMFDQGLQAWFEWRRTGYPVLTPAEDGLNGGKIPVRLRYPSDEYSRNGENVAKAVALQGDDNLNTPVWWDCN